MRLSQGAFRSLMGGAWEVLTSRLAALQGCWDQIQVLELPHHRAWVQYHRLCINMGQ